MNHSFALIFHMPHTMPGLNYAAPEFVPRSGPLSVSSPVAIPSPAHDEGLPEDPWALSDVELSVSPAELEELEAVDSWVQLMSDLEMEEHNHMIEMALRFGDAKRIKEIKQHVAAARRDKASGKQKHHGAEAPRHSKKA